MVGNARYDFAGESALVTGSTSETGRGIARALAEADANVVVNSHVEAGVDETVTALNGVGEGRVVNVTSQTGTGGPVTAGSTGCRTRRSTG